MDDLLLRAARNNAEWCGQVCAAHGAVGRFGYAAWCCETPTPRFYPNLVTLRPDCVSAQTDQVGRLTLLPQGWGVKDSFAQLDLTSLGFVAAIAGEWVEYGRATTGANLDWREIRTPMELQAWEIAWGGEPHHNHPRIFTPAMTEIPTTTFLAGFQQGRLVAGGVVTLAAGVAGLSNIFTTADTPGLTEAVLMEAYATAEGLPLVGWRQAGETDGGRAIGPLKVWLRQ